jgi:proteasome alpha subunit
MIEEPYRWMEAIANRREYIEHQIASGSPIVGLTYRDGILLFTVGRDRQKIFEIYDRIALGAIGHPGDLERLRMTAIELAGAEGFTRSADDVSLRRLATYSLSPALKAAFEQIYGPPYLARMLFAELGRGAAPNLFLRLDYDGSLHSNGGSFGRTFEDFGVVAGTAAATASMERFLRGQAKASASLEKALETAADAWAVGHLALHEPEGEQLPSQEQIAAHRAQQFDAAALEAGLLQRHTSLRITYRSLPEAEIRGLLGDR